MRVSRNFLLQEFIPKSVFTCFGDKSIWFVDKRIITIAQFFRDYYSKPITINDWHIGGKRILSGFRPPSSIIGAKLSQHKFGRAVDLRWLQNNMSMDEIREDIRSNWNLFKTCGITTIELGTDSWIHADCRQINSDELYEVPFFKK